MIDTAFHIVILMASTREQRFGDVAARWVVSRARRHERLELDVVDLAEPALPV